MCALFQRFSMWSMGRDQNTYGDICILWTWSFKSQKRKQKLNLVGSSNISSNFFLLLVNFIIIMCHVRQRRNHLKKLIYKVCSTYSVVIIEVVILVGFIDKHIPSVICVIDKFGHWLSFLPFCQPSQYPLFHVNPVPYTLHCPSCHKCSQDLIYKFTKQNNSCFIQMWAICLCEFASCSTCILAFLVAHGILAFNDETNFSNWPCHKGTKTFKHLCRFTKFCEW